MDTLISVRTALLISLIPGKNYGLGLADHIRSSSNGRISVATGALYPTLRALEREGMLTSHEDDPLPERGGRPRRYYELTAHGMRVARLHRDSIAGIVAGSRCL